MNAFISDDVDLELEILKTLHKLPPFHHPCNYCHRNFLFWKKKN